MYICAVWWLNKEMGRFLSSEYIGPCGNSLWGICLGTRVLIIRMLLFVINFMITSHVPFQLANKTGSCENSYMPIQLAIPKFSRELGRVSNFNQSINWHHHHMKDHVEIGHLPLGWTETKLWTLKCGSESIQTSLILRQYSSLKYSLLNTTLWVIPSSTSSMVEMECHSLCRA